MPERCVALIIDAVELRWRITKRRDPGHEGAAATTDNTATVTI